MVSNAGRFLLVGGDGFFTDDRYRPFLDVLIKCQNYGVKIGVLQRRSFSCMFLWGFNEY